MRNYDKDTDPYWRIFLDETRGARESYLTTGDFGAYLRDTASAREVYERSTSHIQDEYIRRTKC